MAIITVKSVKSKSLLFFRDDKQFGTIEYDGILKTRANVITNNNQIYSMERANFITRKFELKQGGEVFAIAQINFLGSISITLIKTGEIFLIKRKSLIHGKYIMTDNNMNEVFSVYYKFNIFNKDQDITIETTDNFERIKDNLFLCYISVFCLYQKIKDTQYVP